MTDEFYMYNGESLYGMCGHCDRRVDNYDPQHRVTPIAFGGRGVECALRGDVTLDECAPLDVEVS